MPVTELLVDAQNLIYQTLRCREMRSPLTALSIPINEDTVDLPADFLDPIVVLNDFMVPLKLRDQQSLFRRMGVNNGTFVASKPSSYTISGEQLCFNCPALAAYSYWLVYFQKPAPLSPTNNTNFLTNRYSHVLRPAILAVAAGFRKDMSDYNLFSQQMMQLIEDLQVKDDLAWRGVQVDADYSYDRD